MMQTLRESGKRSAGWLISRTSGRYSYRNCIFVLAHMRCGSTALSNILCSRSDVSGYGEAHIRYDGQGALGRLALNQMRRSGWKPGSNYLFDKILHCRHDEAASPEFFESRAIFVVRGPVETIRSIVELFTRLGRRAYDSPQKAALYYAERLETLAGLWQRFPAERRIGITHEALVKDPEATLSCISGHLRFEPALTNQYESSPASRRAGAGDPLVSGMHDRIVPGLRTTAEPETSLHLPATLSARVRQAHDRLLDLFAMQAARYSNIVLK